MKTFEGHNYYQILNISVNSSAGEIRRAYREALAVYEEDSLVTYSLFSDEQRAELLQKIEEAFDTLIDDDKRATYNRILIDSGQVQANIFSNQSQRELAALSDGENTLKAKGLNKWVKKKCAEDEIKILINEVLAKDTVSGADLKKIRETYGIQISEIYEITKISSSVLNYIEANQLNDLPAETYLKYFLRSYAEILQIDPQHVVNGYLKYMSENDKDT